MFLRQAKFILFPAVSATASAESFISISNSTRFRFSSALSKSLFSSVSGSLDVSSSLNVPGASDSASAEAVSSSYTCLSSLPILLLSWSIVSDVHSPNPFPIYLSVRNYALVSPLPYLSVYLCSSIYSPISSLIRLHLFILRLLIYWSSPSIMLPCFPDSYLLAPASEYWVVKPTMLL